MEIIKYDPRYKADFIRFNQDWIVDCFGGLEPEDTEAFDKIEDELASGAMIFFAVQDGHALACCMAKPM